MEEILKKLNQDIKDIFQYNIETTNAYVVPTRNDNTLTFPIGAVKQGKLLKTCVLMVDIRNSTKISRQLRNDKVKLGKIYSAFIYAMADIADDYGYVRNIIGDRIMVVFEPDKCFENAINCAALMYTVGMKILKQYVAMDEFKIGIGIEFGEMLVLKTGIIKKHEELSEYKNLVWIGDAANIASKLCDYANKSISIPTYKVRYETIKTERVLKTTSANNLRFGLPLLYHSYFTEPEYEFKNVTEINTVDLNVEEFARKILVTSGTFHFEDKKVKDFIFENQIKTPPPILISGKVYDEFKKSNPKSPYLSRLSTQFFPDKPYTGGTGVYGGFLIVPEISKIKIG